MQIPVFAWPKAEFDIRLDADVVMTLRTFARRIDVEAVLGCTGWAALVVVIVRSGV